MFTFFELGVHYSVYTPIRPEPEMAGRARKD